MDNDKIYKYLKAEKWYHGTTLFGWKKLCSLGIQVTYNIGNELDFGYGFYLTPVQKQAEYYISNLLKFSTKGLPVKASEDKKIPIIIEFTFCPLEWYEQKTYSFKSFTSYDDEFAKFVFHNRVHNLDGQQHHDFHIIFGVMSDSLPTLQIQKFKNNEITYEEVIEALKKSTSNKQISLHNQEICDKIVPTRAYYLETGEELNIDEYNSTRY